MGLGGLELGGIRAKWVNVLIPSVSSSMPSVYCVAIGLCYVFAF